MKAYYCKICDKTINHKSRNRHNKTKIHYFMKKYVTSIYNHNDIVWGHVENILHEKFISHNNKFIDFKIFVSCKIKDDIETEVYENGHDLRALVYRFTGLDTLYVHVAGKMICNNFRDVLSSTYNNKPTCDMPSKNLSLKFISRYDNMTFRYQLQQPRPLTESKMIKYIKYMSEEEQSNNFIFLSCKHKLSLL